jgi:hypothetical protein
VESPLADNSIATKQAKAAVVEAVARKFCMSYGNVSGHFDMQLPLMKFPRHLSEAKQKLGDC